MKKTNKIEFIIHNSNIRMLFIIIWKVTGLLAIFKNITSNFKWPLLV